MWYCFFLSTESSSVLLLSVDCSLFTVCLLVFFFTGLGSSWRRALFGVFCLSLDRFDYWGSRWREQGVARVAGRLQLATRPNAAAPSVTVACGWLGNRTLAASVVTESRPIVVRRKRPPPPSSSRFNWLVGLFGGWCLFFFLYFFFSSLSAGIGILTGSPRLPSGLPDCKKSERIFYFVCFLFTRFSSWRLCLDLLRAEYGLCVEHSILMNSTGL